MSPEELEQEIKELEEKNRANAQLIDALFTQGWVLSAEIHRKKLKLISTREGLSNS